MKKKSLVDEIIESMEQYLKVIDGGDQHFDKGVFPNLRSAAHYAVSNMIGHAKALKEAR
jgi:hypothetical protein